MEAESKYGEVPLFVLSNGGTVVVYDANGAEVVPFTDEDWEYEGEAQEMVIALVESLKKAYESPQTLLNENASWMESQYEDRSMWADGENGPDWFTPKPLPEPPETLSEADFDQTLPLSVELDAEGWPDDPEQYPDHEVKIVDGTGDVVCRVHAEEYSKGVEPVADLIETIRLAYEAPLALLSRISDKE